MKATLDSLSQVTAPDAWAVEILLVDNNSTDATPDVIQSYRHPKFETRALFENNKGLSFARNRAVSSFSGQVLLFTDDDIRFPANWVVEMCSPIVNGSADAVAGGVTLSSHLQREWMTPLHRGLLASTERIQSGYSDEFVGANMSIGRHVFKTISGFDPELGAGQLGLGEETLFARQMSVAGMRILAQPEVSVEHHPDPDRLKYPALCDAATKGGQSSGYISYHWEHNTYGLLKLMLSQPILSAKLVYAKRRSTLPDNQGEGISVSEFRVRRKLARVKYHLKNRRLQRKYERFGLSKTPAV